MSKTSKVEKLPAELRSIIDRLIVEKRMTFEEIAEHLNSLGGDVSKTGVHRYAQKRAKVNERLRIVREATASIYRDLQSVPQEDHERVLQELVQSTVFTVASNLAELEEPAPKDVLDTAFAIDKLAAAKEKNLKSFALRAKLQAQFAEEAGKRLDTFGPERGLSQDTIEQIKQTVLGVPRKAS